MKSVVSLTVGFLVAACLLVFSPDVSRAAAAGPMTALPEISRSTNLEAVHYRPYRHCHTRYKRHCRWVRHHYKKVYRCYSRPVRYCHGHRAHRPYRRYH